MEWDILVIWDHGPGGGPMGPPPGIWLGPEDQWRDMGPGGADPLFGPNLHLQVDQMDHLQELTWMVMECLLLLQVIWDQDQMDQSPPDDMGGNAFSHG